MAIIDMQMMRYINLLDKTTKVKTRQCFFYNNAIFFAVPRKLVSKAIGPGALYVRSMQQDLGKKIRIIKSPAGIEEASDFIKDIIAPNKFKELEIRDNNLILTAGNNQAKAALIGREKRRYGELQKILKNIFDMDLKIV